MKPVEAASPDRLEHGFFAQGIKKRPKMNVESATYVPVLILGWNRERLLDDTEL